MKFKIHKILLSFFLSIISAQAFAVIVGSTTAVSIQPLVTFPSSDSDNAMLGFAWFTNGFTLQNSATQCVYNGSFPVSGPVNLNGGTLTLDQDLTFGYAVDLQTLGTIIGQGYSINFPRSVTAFPSTATNFQNTNLFVMNDLTITSTIIFTGVCTLNCNGNSLTFGPNGYIVVDTGSTLYLEQCTANNVNNASLQCLDNTGVILLDTVVLAQFGDFTFATGALQFKNDVTITNDGFFVYQSIMTSTVLSNSSLTIDSGMTFSYDPGTAMNLIQFTDQSSELILNNNSTLHATLQGMSLTNGSLMVNGNVDFESEIVTYNDPILGPITIDNNINIGDDTSPDDMFCNIASGATVNINLGSFAYHNVNASSWNLADSSSSIFVNTNAALKLYEQLNMGSSITTFANNAILGRAAGGNLIGSINPLGNIIYESL